MREHLYGQRLISHCVYSQLLSVHSERLLKLATNFSRDKLISVGTCFGKFTKTGKFRLHITALDFLAPYAKVVYYASLHYSVFIAAVVNQSYFHCKRSL